MDQQHRRARADLRRVALDVRSRLRAPACPNSPTMAAGGDRAAQADMQRHHGALGKADQRQRGRRQLVARELGIEERFEHRRRRVARRPSVRRDCGTSAETTRAPSGPGRRGAARAARRMRRSAGTPATRGRSRSGRCRPRRSHARTRQAGAPGRSSGARRGPSSSAGMCRSFSVRLRAVQRRDHKPAIAVPPLRRSSRSAQPAFSPVIAASAATNRSRSSSRV